MILSITRGDDYTVPEKAKLKVLKKYDYKCSCCKIEVNEKIAMYHMENKTVFPLCSLCYYPLHLERLIGKDPGKIILMGELSQIELNSLLRSMEFIKFNKERYEEAADSVEIIETVLKERAEMADVYYAQGISNVDLLVQKLYACSDEDYEKRENGLFGLRWFPNMNNFKKDMEFWNEKSFKKYYPENWKKLILTVAKKTN